MAEAGQLALDAAVAPGWVLGGEAEDESSEFDRCWWATWSSVELCPGAGDAASVPSEEGVGCDDPAVPSLAGERNGDGAEQGSVVVVDLRSVDLAA